MDLINWSLNAIDTLFSRRSSGSGEPHCPHGTLPAGYMMDGWKNWRILCLAGLSIEDIEDIYLFGTMITGILLIGAGFALAYRELEKVASAAQTPTSMAAGMDSLGTAMSTQSVLIDRKTDNISGEARQSRGSSEYAYRAYSELNITEQLTDLVGTQTMRIEPSMDKILEKLTALQREIERPNDQ